MLRAQEHTQGSTTSKESLAIGPFPRLALLLARAAGWTSPPVTHMPEFMRKKRCKHVEISGVYPSFSVQLLESFCSVKVARWRFTIPQEDRTGFNLRETWRIHPEYWCMDLGKEAMWDCWATAPFKLSPPPLLYYVLLPPFLRLSPRVSVLTPKIPRPCA